MLIRRSAKINAESVDLLKKSTKSESENCLPRWMIREIQSVFSCWSCLACVILCFRVKDNLTDTRKKNKLELPNNQNPKSGPKNWIKPRSAVIIGSADPLNFALNPESGIKYLPNPPIRRPIHPPLYSSLISASQANLSFYWNCACRGVNVNKVTG